MSIFDSFGSAALDATFGAIAGAAMDNISPNSSNVFDFCSDSSSMLNGAINGALIGGLLEPQWILRYFRRN